MAIEALGRRTYRLRIDYMKDNVTDDDLANFLKDLDNDQTCAPGIGAMFFVDLLKNSINGRIQTIANDLREKDINRGYQPVCQNGKYYPELDRSEGYYDNHNEIRGFVETEWRPILQAIMNEAAGFSQAANVFMEYIDTIDGVFAKYMDRKVRFGHRQHGNSPDDDYIPMYQHYKVYFSKYRYDCGLEAFVQFEQAMFYVVNYKEDKNKASVANLLEVLDHFVKSSRFPAEILDDEGVTDKGDNLRTCNKMAKMQQDFLRQVRDATELSTGRPGCTREAHTQGIDLLAFTDSKNDIECENHVHNAWWLNGWGNGKCVRAACGTFHEKPFKSYEKQITGGKCQAACWWDFNGPSGGHDNPHPCITESTCWKPKGDHWNYAEGGMPECWDLKNNGGTGGNYCQDRFWACGVEDLGKSQVPPYERTYQNVRLYSNWIYRYTMNLAYSCFEDFDGTVKIAKQAGIDMAGDYDSLEDQLKREDEVLRRQLAAPKVERELNKDVA